MKNERGDDTRSPDRDIARLLEAAGPREQLPEDLKLRWEAHFRTELETARRARRRRFAIPLGALAAGIVALALVLDRPGGNDPEQIPMQVLAVAGGSSLLENEATRRPAAPGLDLAVGSVLETAADSRLKLNWAGFDVRLNERTRIRLLSDRLQLDEGELYVSNQGQRTALRSAAIVTPLATVRDVGTQFKVRYDGGRLSASVRTGSIVVETATGRQQADAASGTKQQVLVGVGGEVTVLEDRSDWTWIYPVAEPFALEGRSVLEFLQWYAAESGQELRFADEGAELAAGYTRFSGGIDMAGLNPEQAVTLVLSTTRFETRQEHNSLLISRRSE